MAALFDTDEDNRKEIPYSDEDPKIREYFEAEVAKRGVTSLMPPECYEDPKYEWGYRPDEP